MGSWMGVDLGSSSVRAMIVTDQGEVLALAGRAYGVQKPAPGWVEQDPEAWFSAACAVIAQALAKVGSTGRNVEALSFSGQMHGLVAVEKDGAPVRPAIIWEDGRTAGTIRSIYDRLGEDLVANQVQNRLAPGFLLPSLLWLKQNEPDSYRRIHKVMLPKDYLKFRLCGEICTDPSDAAGALCYNNLEGQWATPLLEALDLDPALLPPVRPSAEVVGTLTPSAAAATGLAAGTPVVNGGADQCMQAVGSGVLAPGVFACNIGTGGQISTTVQGPIIDPAHRSYTFAHALPRRWNLMGTTLSAGLAYKWFAGEILAADDYKALDAEAAKLPPGGGDGLVFLPYLLGERTPHQNPGASGVFFGLRRGHTRAHLVRAVMEGVVFSLKDCYGLLTGALGVACTRIVAAGGGAASPLWLQMQADILEREVATSVTGEQACFGAALTAGVGLGCWPGLAAASAALVRPGPKTYTPDPARAAAYRDLYALYGALYRRNETLFGAGACSVDGGA